MPLVGRRWVASGANNQHQLITLIECLALGVCRDLRWCCFLFWFDNRREIAASLLPQVRVIRPTRWLVNEAWVIRIGDANFPQRFRNHRADYGVCSAWINICCKGEILNVLDSSAPVFESKAGYGAVEPPVLSRKDVIGARVEQHTIAVAVVKPGLASHIVKLCLMATKGMRALENVGVTAKAIAFTLAAGDLRQVALGWAGLGVVVVGGMPIKPSVDVFLVLAPGQFTQCDTVVLSGKSTRGGALAVVHVVFAIRTAQQSSVPYGSIPF